MTQEDDFGRSRLANTASLSSLTVVRDVKVNIGLGALSTIGNSILKGSAVMLLGMDAPGSAMVEFGSTETAAVSML